MKNTPYVSLARLTKAFLVFAVIISGAPPAGAAPGANIEGADSMTEGAKAEKAAFGDAAACCLSKCAQKMSLAAQAEGGTGGAVDTHGRRCREACIANPQGYGCGGH